MGKGEDEPTQEGGAALFGEEHEDEGGEDEAGKTGRQGYEERGMGDGEMGSKVAGWQGLLNRVYRRMGFIWQGLCHSRSLNLQ